MKENIISFVNKLEGYKTAIKNLHWSSSNMSEHKLFDDIASSVADIQDEISEIEQGLHGKIGKNELKPTSYTIETSKKFLKDILNDTNNFYKTIDGEEYVGMRSNVENFLGELNKYDYLLDLCLKEGIKRRLKKRINEGWYDGFEDDMPYEDAMLYADAMNDEMMDRYIKDEDEQSAIAQQDFEDNIYNDYVNYIDNMQENKKNMEIIKLTESQLHRLIKESVNRILVESNDIVDEHAVRELLIIAWNTEPITRRIEAIIRAMGKKDRSTISVDRLAKSSVMQQICTLTIKAEFGNNAKLSSATRKAFYYQLAEQMIERIEEFQRY